MCANYYGVFLKSCLSYGFRLFAVSMTSTIIANPTLNATHGSPWKFTSMLLFIPFVSLKVGDGSCFRFSEGNRVGGTSLLEAFPCLFSLSSLHHPLVRHFCFPSETISWNFLFFGNLNNRNIQDFKSLLLLLENVDVSYSCKLLFHFLTHSPNSQKFFYDKIIWKAKAPSKVKSFVWTVVLNRINTNDLLQFWRPKTAIFPNICVMCMNSSELFTHLSFYVRLLIIGCLIFVGDSGFVRIL